MFQRDRDTLYDKVYRCQSYWYYLAYRMRIPKNLAKGINTFSFDQNVVKRKVM